MRHALVVGVALLEGGWFAFDGIRALVAGDYVTPPSKDLGPWARVPRALGVDPRSTGMKLFFATYGLAWLCAAGAFALGAPHAARLLVAAAIGALWYAPFGTILSAVQLVLLLS